MAEHETPQQRFGRKGGKKLLRKKGRKYFAALAAKRKNFRGGRPKKNSL